MNDFKDIPDSKSNDTTNNIFKDSNKTELEWLNIESFPDSYSVQRENTPEEDDEYIEYDRDLFNIHSNISRLREKHRKVDLNKMFPKIRNLKRKAMVKLSKEKPIIIDRLSTHKLTFSIDLRGSPIVEKLPRIKIKTRKSLPVLGEVYRDIISHKNRFFSVKFSNFACTIIESDIFSNQSERVFIPDCSIPSFTEESGATSETIEKISSLNKKVHENPGDVCAWLHLIDLQCDKLVGSSEKIIADSQIAVLNKALLANPSSEELLLKQMYIQYNVSDSQTMRNAIEDIVFKFPNRIKFWELYFTYNNSDFSKLNFSRGCEFYAKAMFKLNSLRSPLVRSSQRLSDVTASQYLFRIYAHLSMFMLSMDYTERLTSLFQLLIDFNWADIASTNIDKSNIENQRLFLEAYWDTEEHKLGMDNWTGLNEFARKKKQIQNHNPIYDFNILKKLNYTSQFVVKEEFCTKIETDIADSNDILQAWLSIESYRSSRHFFAIANAEEVDDNDRIVLFEDISSFIYLLDSSLRFELFLLFLCILGVPIPRKFAPLLDSCFPDSILLTDFSLHLPHVINELESIIGDSNIILKRNISPLWNVICQNDISCNIQIDPNAMKFIRNLLSSAVSYKLLSQEHKQQLSLIWVQFEILIALTTPNFTLYDELLLFIRKILELSENSQYSPIWLLYSYILIYSSNPKMYVKTMQRLIRPFSDNGFTDTKSSSIFIRFYLENLVLNDFIQHIDRIALKNLVRMYVTCIINDDRNDQEFDMNSAIIKYINTDSSSDPYTKACVIIIQFFYIYIFEAAESAFKIYKEWLEYCHNKISSYSINKKANKKFRFLYVSYDKSSLFYTISKNIYEHFSVIINHSKMISYVQPTVTEDILFKAINMFPESTLIQQWFQRFSQTILLFYPFRLCYDHILKNICDITNTQLTPWIFNVYYDVFSCLRVYHDSKFERDIFILNNVSYRVTNYFESLISHQYFRFRPIIWRIYLRIMHFFGDSDALKSVFYRSLQHVPWCKDIYCDAILFKILPLQSVLDMMVEKGIRLRLPLEELELIRSW